MSLNKIIALSIITIASLNATSSMTEFKKSKNENIKYRILNQTLNDIENFNKHKIVALILQGENLPSLNITKSEINNKLQKYIQKAPNIKIASQEV